MVGPKQEPWTANLVDNIAMRRVQAQLSRGEILVLCKHVKDIILGHTTAFKSRRRNLREESDEGHQTNDNLSL